MLCPYVKKPSEKLPNGGLEDSTGTTAQPFETQNSQADIHDILTTR